jgi:hypothetical protein
MKLEIYRQIFENIEMKFHENPSSASRFFPRGQRDGQMDKQTDMSEANSRFSQFAKSV